MRSIPENFIKTLLICCALLPWTACKDRAHQPPSTTNPKDPVLLKVQPPNIKTPEGMVWVSGKTFIQGGKQGDAMAMAKELPAHSVTVDGFFMDRTEVSNRQFEAFVDATGYLTVAERPIDWELLQLELPQGTPKPHDSVLQPGSMVFNKQVTEVSDRHHYGQWWTWQVGASWKHPEGPDSSLQGKDNYPVVHIAYEDALAYCRWANRRLPTEAEWESAAQGKNNDAIFTWGNDVGQLYSHANTWQGEFPTKNRPQDGFGYVAPVQSFPANSIGIYDLLGNVWEWTADWYDETYYGHMEGHGTSTNTKGSERTSSTSNPYQKQRVIKGGSYLCHASYCASYRISAKMGMPPDSSTDHVGFRTVATIAMLKGSE